MLVAVTSVWLWPEVLRGLAYDLQHDWRRARLLDSFSAADRLESDNFVLYYHADLDEAWAAAVLATAEGAREAVARRLGWSPLVTETSPEKVPILLYCDQAALDRQFGPGLAFRALGAYWSGVIQVLSPRVWLEPTPTLGAQRVFWTQGPMVHEYTHYVLDQLVPHGNYPRWLSEGLAQYVEYRETGYLWLEPSNRITLPLDEARLYRLDELTRDFDDLENTALAYRQAFLLVAYMMNNNLGREGVNELLSALSDGRSLAEAVEALTGRTLKELERDWLLWLEWSLDRYSAGGPESPGRLPPAALHLTVEEA